MSLGAKIAAAVGILIVLSLYFNGQFDRFLVQFGLNAEDCINTFAFDELCGDQAESFCQQFYDPVLNGEACDQILG